MKKSLICAAAVAMMLPAYAQQLNTEVNIDRTVKPVVRQSQRLRGVVPEIVVPQVQKPRLEVSEYAGAGEITNEICPMPAARWADSITRTPYRGYASLGYLPELYIGAAAGYRFIDSDRADIGVYGSYNAAKYSSALPYSPDATFLNNCFTVGADGSWHATRNGNLTFGGAYTYDAVRRPLVDAMKYDQGSHKADFDLSWLSQVGTVRYHVDLGVGYFSFNNAIPDALGMVGSPLNQTMVSVGAGAALCRTGHTTPWLGMDIDYAALRTNDFYPQVGGVRTNATLGQMHVHPYFTVSAPGASLRLGVNAGLATGTGGAHFKLAPEVYASLTPSAPVTFFASMSGGEHLNPASALYAINPYMYQYEAPARSNIPLRIDAGVNFTPMTGLQFGAKGGYAVVKDGLLPTVFPLACEIPASGFSGYNYNSWYLGINGKAVLRKILVLSADATVAGADKDNASWCEWHDGARFRGNVSLLLTPIDRLDVTVAYAYAGGRRIMDYRPMEEPALLKLDAVSSLDANITYRFTPAVTFFADVRNILGKRYRLISLMPSAGVHGLVGASVKF